ncbi:MAG: hypothetical protein ACREIV_10175, partial [Planctomycetaceae bacterium]
MLVVGLIAAAALLVGAFVDPTQFFRSYLLAWLLLLMVATGSIGVLMIQNLTGGVWGILMRRPAEAAAGTMPVVALAFLPVLFGLGHLYTWAHPEIVAHDEILRHKAAYLNPVGFTIRSVAFFALWTIFAMLLLKWG